MGQEVRVKITPEGVLVSHPLVLDWGRDREIEVEQIDDALIIRPKVCEPDEVRQRIVSQMKAAGLIEDLPWPQPRVVSSEERRRLAEKLSHGKPLSRIILEERDEYQ